MASHKGSAKAERNLNLGNINFKENQIVSEKEAICDLLYSSSLQKSNILNKNTLKEYKTLYKKGELSPNVIEEILIKSGFEKVESKWKYINNKIK